MEPCKIFRSERLLLHPSWRRFIAACAFILLVMTSPVIILGPSGIENSSFQLSARVSGLDSHSLAGLVKSTIVLRNNTIVPGNYAPNNGHNPDIPTSIAYASKNNHLYVTGGESLMTGRSLNTIYIVDGNTNRVIAQRCLDACPQEGVIPQGLGAFPKGLAYDPTRNVMYVAGGQAVLGISDDSLRIVANITMPLAGPWLTGVAYDSVDDALYVGDSVHSLVYRVSLPSMAVSSLPVASTPMGIAYDSDNNRLYVNCLDYVSVIDAASNSVVTNATLNLSSYPNTLRTPQAFQNIVYDSSDKVVYLVGVEGASYNPRSPPTARSGVEFGHVLIFDPSTNELKGQIGSPSSISSVTYNPRERKVYATIYEQTGSYYRNDDLVTVFDSATWTVRANVTVGLGPTGLAYDAENGDVYVASARSDSVSVISGNNDSLVETFKIQNYPVGVAYDPDNHLLYVADEGSYGSAAYKDSISSTLLIVNPGNGFVREVDTGGIGPNMVAYNDYNKNIYVTNFIYGNVTVISGTTNKIVAQVPVPSAQGAFDILYNPANHNMYVSNQNENTISLIAGASNSVLKDIVTGNHPLGLAYDSKDNLIWVTHYSLEGLTGSFVTAIDGTTNGVVANITMPIGSSPLGIAYDPRNNDVYVANFEGNNVTVIDGSTRRISNTIQLSQINYTNPIIPQPYAQHAENLVYDANQDLIYVTPQLTGDFSTTAANQVWVIDPGKNQLLGNFTAGSVPTDGAYDPDNGFVYLSNYRSGTLSVVGIGKPTTIYGLQPLIFFGLIGSALVSIALALIVLVRRRSRKASQRTTLI